MPRVSKAKYAAHWLRLLSEKEVRMARAAYQILSLEARKVSKAYESAGYAASLQALNELQNTWLKMLVNFYGATIPSFVIFTSLYLNPNKVKMPTFIERQQAFIKKQGLKKIKEINATSVKRLKRIIDKGVQGGKSQGEIAKDIKDGLKAVSTWRSKTIARTEVHTAASWASQETAKSSGRELDREWVAVSDDRTRQTHADADGQIVGLNEPFKVGDDELDYPGDPSGSPEETINCRCAVIYLPKSVFDISDYEYF